MRPWASLAVLVVGTVAAAAVAPSTDTVRRSGLAVAAASGTGCPPGSTLRYQGGGDGASEPADFGKSFFARYCTRCHGSAIVGSARSGAPPDLNWDEPQRIRELRAWIDVAAAARGTRKNYDMPPRNVPAQPTDAERELLARWIACGAP